MLRGFSQWAFALIILSLLVFGTWPQLLQLHRVLPVAQLVALRGIVLVIAGVCFLVLLLVALGASRSSAAAGIGLTMLLVVIMVNGLVLFMRGFGGDAPGAALARSDAEQGIVALVWNTLGHRPSVETIAQLALDEGADVISLPETRADYAQEIADRLAMAGRPMQLLTAGDGSEYLAPQTALLISIDLGAYRIAPGHDGTEGNHSVFAEPMDPGSQAPLLVAVHTAAPFPTWMDVWESDLRQLAPICADEPAILFGDFNATLDHFSGLESTGIERAVFGSCRDASLERGAGGVGTWPTWSPPLLGTPIDRVLATPHYEVAGFRVVTELDDAGSDHRPVVAELVPAG